MQCPRCKKPLAKAEVVAYGGTCEDCWASGPPDDGKSSPPRTPAQGHATKRIEPSDLRWISNLQKQEEEVDEDGA